MTFERFNIAAHILEKGLAGRQRTSNGQQSATRARTHRQKHTDTHAQTRTHTLTHKHILRAVTDDAMPRHASMMLWAVGTLAGHGVAPPLSLPAFAPPSPRHNLNTDPLRPSPPSSAYPTPDARSAKGADGFAGSAARPATVSPASTVGARSTFSMGEHAQQLQPQTLYPPGDLWVRTHVHTRT